MPIVTSSLFTLCVLAKVVVFLKLNGTRTTGHTRDERQVSWMSWRHHKAISRRSRIVNIELTEERYLTVIRICKDDDLLLHREGIVADVQAQWH
jgi:hypothetical protein